MKKITSLSVAALAVVALSGCSTPATRACGVLERGGSQRAAMRVLERASRGIGPDGHDEAMAIGRWEMEARALCPQHW